MKWGQGMGRKIVIWVMLVVFAGVIPAKADPPKTNTGTKTVVVVKHLHRRWYHRHWRRHHRHRRRVLLRRLRRLRRRLHRLKKK